MAAFTALEVRRDDLRSLRFAHDTAPAGDDLGANEVLLEVDRFALTANNLTYAVVGEVMSYWSFFPAREGWGRVPVWGFGNVVASRSDTVPEGERVYGYFPIATHLKIEAGAVTPAVIVDATAHRQALPPFYNQYHRTGGDPFYSPGTEPQAMLLRPLFLTAFLLDDLLAGESFFGARSVGLTSASSKTSFALAALLSERNVDVIGFTSKRNVPFVERLGCYDRVVSYEDIETLPAEPIDLVDMAGNVEVLTRLHRHFGDGVKQSTLVGLTHWERQGQPGDLPGATPAFFFAPDRAAERIRDWGGAGFESKVVDAWKRFLVRSEGWLRIVPGRGEKAVEGVFRDTLEGRVNPEEGHILSLLPER